MLKKILEFFTCTLLKLEHATRVADTVYSFSYEAIEIFLLLSVIIFTVFFIGSCFPSKKTKPILSHKNKLIRNILATGVIPIVYALMVRVFSMGTVLAFMMAVTALSLPKTIILRKVLKMPLLAVFAGVMTITITAAGYLFNAIL
jgi:uncharacterized membrane protein YraQ (UPF0718 family)